MSAEVHEASQTGDRAIVESNESTAFYIWLLITVSAGIIMAQDTWVSLQQPRLGTVDATAAFTKVLVIHGIWLLVTLGFIGYTWFARPNSAWKIHLVMGALTVVWTIGVLVWSFGDVERLEVTTWRCDSAPADNVATEAFLETCDLTDEGGNLRLGGDIYFWSADDKHHWRWIVPGEGMSTMQTRWPNQVSDMYLSTGGEGATLMAGAESSIPGGIWTAGFDPQSSRVLRIYYIESAPTTPDAPATPDAHTRYQPIREVMFHERFRFTT